MPSRETFSKARIGRKIFRNLAAIEPTTKEKHRKGNGVKLSRKSKDSGADIPTWFLTNCVKTAEELAESDAPLIIRESMPLESDAAPESDVQKADVYIVESVVYKPLLDVLSSALPGATSHDSNRDSAKTFANDAVHLRFPERHRAKGGIQFLTAIVNRFARDAKADLMILSIDDLYDLAEHFTGSEFRPEMEDLDIDRFMKRYRDQDDYASGDDDGTHSEDVEVWSHPIQMKHPQNLFCPKLSFR